MELAADRECGECSVCCTVLNVDTPEFQKLPGKPCAHLRAQGGCAIHATRFPVCRAYHCAWRHLAALGEAWRPDRSGVLIGFLSEDLPERYPKRPGVSVTVFRALDPAFAPLLLRFIAGLIVQKVPVILAVPGPAGHFPARALINGALEEAVVRRDFPASMKIFSQAFAALNGHRFSPVVHRHGTAPQNDTRPLAAK